MDDARIHFLDYSAGVIAAGGTSDGCHLNPGGAVRLGVRLASDISGRV
jgi:lysophospholipase L1-like esterase